MKKNRKKRKININTITKISLGVLVFSVVAYVYMINFATFNTAKVQNFSEEISKIQSKIGELELSYMEKTKIITMEKAKDFDLVQQNSKTSKIFVRRDQNTKLTLNTQE